MDDINNQDLNNKNNFFQPEQKPVRIKSGGGNLLINPNSFMEMGGAIWQLGQREIYNPNPVTDMGYKYAIDLDGQFQALYNIISLPIRAATWSIKTRHVGGEAERKLIDDNFTNPPHSGGLHIPINQTIASCLQAILYGRACFEQVWKYNEKEKTITLKKLAPRPAYSCIIQSTPNGVFNGFRQQLPNRNIIIPPEKCSLFVANKEWHQFYGRSYFQPAYEHFLDKQKVLFMLKKGIEISITGINKGTYDNTLWDADSAEVDTLEKTLKEFGFKTFWLLPNGMNIENVKVNFESAAVMQYLEYLDDAMAKSVLAQFMNLKGGSYALSKDHSQIFSLSSQPMLQDIADMFNFYIIPKIIDFNFTSKKYPYFEFSRMDDKTLDALNKVFGEMLSGGYATLTTSFVQEIEKKMATVLSIPLTSVMADHEAGNIVTKDLTKGEVKDNKDIAEVISNDIEKENE